MQNRFVSLEKIQTQNKINGLDLITRLYYLGMCSLGCILSTYIIVIT